ncbi:hypothetical protein [Flexithrix dorotheae]|uniref:hypothetical protein n=1 Tax=Flexithrix dorotheae TaxID=70993 RepID=UPI0012FB604C|nr:hypothetical protein [Flexithrix dorotheae]
MAKGEPLYKATTFGYTPLAILVVGFFMWVGKLFSISTLISAKIVGIILYGLICTQLFRLVSVVYIKMYTVFLACIFFLGLGYLPMLSGVNAEPKLWVLLFTILGIRAVIKFDWFFTGLYFSLSAMCWHASVISLFPCLILIPWKDSRFIKSSLNFTAGILIGILPVIIYLFVTQSWGDFWIQAVLRKLVVEGESVGESPLIWFYRGLYPFFIPEIIHFVVAFVGFVIICIVWFTGNITLKKYFRDECTLKFLIGFTIVWGAFNCLEFQTPVDLFPLLPVLMIFCAYLVQFLNRRKKTILVLIPILLYNFYDAIVYDIPYKINDQIRLAKNLKENYGKAFVVGFEEIFTVLEEPMPTRFMRYSSYEDHLIYREPGGCDAISRKLKTEKFQVIIEMDWEKRERSKYSQSLIEQMQSLLNQNDLKRKRSGCAGQLIETLTSQNPSGNFTMIIQSIPMGKFFYTKEYYSIYAIE